MKTIFTTTFLALMLLTPLSARAGIVFTVTENATAGTDWVVTGASGTVVNASGFWGLILTGVDAPTGPPVPATGITGTIAGASVGFGLSLTDSNDRVQFTIGGGLSDGDPITLANTNLAFTLSNIPITEIPLSATAVQFTGAADFGPITFGAAPGTAAVPEPSSFLLFGLMAVGAVGTRSRKRRFEERTAAEATETRVLNVRR